MAATRSGDVFVRAALLRSIADAQGFFLRQRVCELLARLLAIDPDARASPLAILADWDALEAIPDSPVGATGGDDGGYSSSEESEGDQPEGQAVGGASAPSAVGHSGDARAATDDSSATVRDRDVDVDGVGVLVANSGSSGSTSTSGVVGAGPPVPVGPLAGAGVGDGARVGPGDSDSAGRGVQVGHGSGTVGGGGGGGGVRPPSNALAGTFPPHHWQPEVARPAPAPRWCSVL